MKIFNSWSGGKGSLLPWAGIRLAALLMPSLTSAILSKWGEASFGAGIGAFLGISVFLLIGYGEARRQARLAPALAHIGLSHSLVGALLLAFPPLWKPGGGHPPLPAAFLVVPWLLLTILPSLLGGFLAVAFPIHPPPGPGRVSPRLTLADGFLLLGGQICGFLLFAGKGIPTWFLAGVVGLLGGYVILKVVRNRWWLILVPLIVIAKASVTHFIYRPASLQRAVSAGDVTKVEQLISQGSNVNAKDRQGNTPLFEALKRGDQAAIKLLLKAGADPNSHPPFWADSLTMAIDRKDAGLVKMLLDHGADPNVRGSDSNTPLLVAIISHQKEIVLLLLDHGADANAKTSWGNSPLYTATIAKDDEIAALLQTRGAK